MESAEDGKNWLKVGLVRSISSKDLSLEANRVSMAIPMVPATRYQLGTARRPENEPGDQHTRFRRLCKRTEVTGAGGGEEKPHGVSTLFLLGSSKESNENFWNCSNVPHEHAVEGNGLTIRTVR